jgi:YQGE family putative transporter
MKAFLGNEKAQFGSLDAPSRRLFFSFLLFSVAGSFLPFFIGAFILRSYESAWLVVAYNAAVFVGLPAGFFANTFLIRRFAVTRLYFLGAVGSGAVFLPLALISGISSAGVVVSGFLFGLAFGLYWGNRHFMTLSITKARERSYFFGTLTAAAMTIGVFTPMAVGWSIVAGEEFGWYLPRTAYLVLMAIAVLILSTAGWAAKPLQENVQRPSAPLAPYRFGAGWWSMRLLMSVMGMTSGIGFFMVSLLTFFLVGKEGVLGALNSAAVVCGAAAVYFLVGRSASRVRFRLIKLGVAVGLFGAALLAASFDRWGLLLYVMFQAFAGPFVWSVIEPLSLDMIEHDTTNVPQDGYRYIVDREVFLNVGRLAGAGVFILTGLAISYPFALRFAPLFLAALQLTIVFLRVASKAFAFEQKPAS